MFLGVLFSTLQPGLAENFPQSNSGAELREEKVKVRQGCKRAGARRGWGWGGRCRGPRGPALPALPCSTRRGTLCRRSPSGLSGSPNRDGTSFVGIHGGSKEEAGDADPLSPPTGVSPAAAFSPGHLPPAPMNGLRSPCSSGCDFHLTLGFHFNGVSLSTGR